MFDKILRWREQGKKRREIEQLLRKEGRVPPGQRVTLKFPVLHLGRAQKIDPAVWAFTVRGEVKKPVQLSWAEFQMLPRTKVTLDLHCVTQWSKFDTVWEGVSLKTLIDLGIIELKPEAKFMVQIAEGGYKTNLPLSIALQENFLLATHYNGEPITQEHGFPLRGVLGHIVGRDDLEDVYLWKGAKWLRTLKFTSKDEPGTWETSGYHNEGDVWREERWGRRFG